MTNELDIAYITLLFVTNKILEIAYSKVVKHYHKVKKHGLRR